ncbi:MAG: tetratricopeptide repeat protein [Pseudomonadota bacterium]|nr:tetratricopeptide repeat protein [Pseudomonadota bacterium]
MNIFLIAGIVLVLLFLTILLLLKRKFSSSSRSKQPDNVSKDNEASEDQGILLHSYFRGLSYILSNETDRALVEFIKVAQMSSATSEIYLALGQLFRNTGEVDRAIRVHRNLLLRSSLPEDITLQTMFEIGLDYKKAGLIERAGKTFAELHEKAPTYVDALRELGGIYELGREWDKAIMVQKKLTELSDSDNSHNILAHLTTEMAKDAEQSGNDTKAASFYRRAIGINENCMDAWLHLGDLQIKTGKEQEALKSWRKAFELNPDLVSLVVGRFSQLPAERTNQIKDEFFRHYLDKYSDNVHFILCYSNFLLDNSRTNEAADWIKRILATKPDAAGIFAVVAKLVRATENCGEYQWFLQNFFDTYKPVNKPYQCCQCGYQLDEVVWKCPKCAHWDTIAPR